MVEDPQEYLNLLFDLESPVYYSIFLTLALFVLIVFVYRYIVSPLRKKHLIEKKELELKNIKLMALFAELDPNPLIRIDEKGMIIHHNDAAKNLNTGFSITGKNIKDIIGSINFPVKDYIKNDKSSESNESINGRYYSISFKGISYLNIAQIYFDDLTERKVFEEELKLSRAKLSELSNHLRDTLEDERQRIARELHDSIGQNLYMIRMKIQNNGFSNEIKFPGSEYKTLLDSIEISINELKEIIYNLKPKVLEEMGLGFSLKVLIKKISDETGILGTADIYGDEERLDKKLELTLYRLSQEALNNIIKHSKANEFNIQLMYKEKSIRMLISDNGIGFDPQNLSKEKFNSGFGLLNMRERINAYNGSLKIDSSLGSGTITIIEIPKNQNG